MLFSIKTTPVKQVIPAEDLLRNIATPTTFVLFGPSAWESETRNWVKPRIIQIASFRCRRWYGRCVCIGKSIWRTPVHLVWGEVQTKTFAKQDRGDGTRFLFTVPQISKHPVLLLISATPRWDNHYQGTTGASVSSGLWLPSRKCNQLCSYTGSVLWQHRLLRSLLFCANREDFAMT